MYTIGVDLGSQGRVALRNATTGEIVALPLVEAYFRRNSNDGVPLYVFGSSAIPTSVCRLICCAGFVLGVYLLWFGLLRFVSSRFVFVVVVVVVCFVFL